MKFFGIFCLILIVSVKTQSINEDDNFYQLPNNKIKIHNYDLRIIPFVHQDLKFEGEININIYTFRAIECLVMNSKELDMKEIRVVTRRTTHEVAYEMWPEKEMLRICVKPSLPYYTSVNVTISYSGKIRDDFKGLYRIHYDENGVEKWLAATQLEPTYARMVFPCFDEPQYNAKFSLSIARYPDQTSTSVTKLKSTSNKDPKNDNRVWDIFETSMPCPTYMMTFAVHSFTCRTKQVVEQLGDLSIYSRKHTDKDAEFITSNYLNWYKTLSEYLDAYGYFDVKMNIVALPDGDEFSQKGAFMIYKEKDVLQIEGIDAEKHKEEITKASIHKIYHLWMGSYVRLHSWRDTWLRESFGVYFQYVMANQIHPEWDMEDRFVTEVLQEALFEQKMHFDLVLSSSTKSPSEIQSQKFNSFINKKGAAIINMLQQVIDNYLHEGFKNAIHKTHDEDSDMTPDDLWDEIDREIKNKDLLPYGIQVETFMQTWLQSSDYPLITVLTNERGEVVLKQEMYYSSPTTTNKILDYYWIVPITCEKKSTTSGKHYVTWLQDSKPVTTNYQLNKDEWVSCNLKQGYYRVTYSKENWNLLIEQLKSQPHKMNNINRAQLIDDSFHLAIHKKISFSTAFNLGTYLEKESNMLPWFSFIRYATHLLRFYEKTDANDYLKRYFLDLIKHQFYRIGFEPRADDSYMVKIGRPYILSIACQLGLADCIANSARMYNNAYISDFAKIPAELQYVVYCNSFETLKDKQAAWDKLWAMYKNSQAMSEKELILSSLACVNDENFFEKYLGMTIDSEGSALFQYEKECIIKSSAKFYKGITAMLDVINEIVPKLRFQSEKNNQTVLLMAEEIHFNIDSLQHVEKAKEIIQQLENYQDKNIDLLTNLRKCIDLGTSKVDYKNKNSGELKQTIQDVMRYDPPTTTTHQPPTSPSSTSTHNHTTITNPSKVTTDSPQISSSVCRVTPLMVTYLIIIMKLIFNET